MTWQRLAMVNSDHVRKALWADWMASSTSAAVACGAWAITRPVLESVTSMYFSAADSRHSLSMQILSVFTSFTTCAISVLSYPGYLRMGIATM